MEQAPFFSDIAEAPDGTASWWLRTRDDVRVRIAVWRKGVNGTVLLFPGRSEYVEKYGRAAKELANRGFATIAIDWRGQGLADRFTKNPVLGHVDEFSDYQHDLSAMLEAAKQLALPRPYFLIAHSMGGAIGLKAIDEGLDIKAVMFSAPMWGIDMPASKRPLAWAVSCMSRKFGFSHMLTPDTSDEAYVGSVPFEDNMLTTDRDMWDYMKLHLETHPEFALAGPTLGWLNTSLRETRRLRRMNLPDMPALTWLGSNERIVDVEAIHQVMNRWKTGQLEVIEGAEHEVLMERPDIVKRIYDETTDFFLRHR